MNEDDPIDQPDLRNLPADEQQRYAPTMPAPPIERFLLLGGGALMAIATISWKLLRVQHIPSSLWVVFTLGTGFFVCGAWLRFYRRFETPFLHDRFSAWGRFIFGVALTFIGAVAKNRVVYGPPLPPEAAAMGVMCLIVGLVLCAWACYGTFVKDRAEQDKGILFIMALATCLVLALT